MDSVHEPDAPLDAVGEPAAPRLPPRRSTRQAIWSRQAVDSIRCVTELVVRQLDVARCGVWALPDDATDPLCVDVFLREGARHVREPVGGPEESMRLRRVLQRSALVVVPALDDRSGAAAPADASGTVLLAGASALLAVGMHRRGRLSLMLTAEQRAAPRKWTDGEVRMMQATASVVREIVGSDGPSTVGRIGRGFVDGLPMLAYRCGLGERGWIVSDITDGAERMLGQPAAHFIGGDLEALRDALRDASPDADGTPASELPSDLPVFEHHYRRTTLDAGVRHFLEKGSVSVDPTTGQLAIDGVVVEYAPHPATSREVRPAASAEAVAPGHLIAELSHELRTPLNAILGFAQLLELAPAPADDQQRAHAAQIRRAGLYLLDLIDGTLDLSRIESGALELDAHTVDLTSIIEAALPFVATQAATAGVEIVVAPKVDGGAQVRGDPRRLRQVVVNLLSNAIKYNRRGGRVVLAVAREAAGVRLRVTDTGVGMTKEQLASLFRPFNRLGMERSGIGGAGLGLVITQRLVQAMGGTIEVRSEESIGTTFEVWFAGPASASDR